MDIQAVLADERAAESSYQRRLRERASLSLENVAMPRSGLWTGSAQARAPQVNYGELVGRVSLAAPEADHLDGKHDFYIGFWHAEVSGTQVFSWAAPVACTYYRGLNHHTLCEQVAIIRSFRHQDGKIVSFADDQLRSDHQADPFPSRSLSVPQPPSGSRRRLPTTTSDPRPKLSATRPDSEPSSSVTASGLPPVRAERLVREALAAPRRASLSPILSTLQPDQYEYVTIPATENQIIEGKPGTGKTIIAAHRAAWMVNPTVTVETPWNTLDGDVLVIGPTDAYSHHVRGVINQLSGGSQRIRVISLPTLLARLADVPAIPPGGEPESWQDVDAELAEIAEAAVHRAKSQIGERATVDDAYKMLRANKGLLGYPITEDLEWSDYLSELPPLEEAKRTRRLIPLLAALGWLIRPPSDLRDIEHVVVDEAQDVHAIEWRILDEINDADYWTLLGDLNQRRSDYSLASWSQVSETIRIDSSDAKIRRLERGYRSTAPILEYANQLLPKSERTLLAFQSDGPDPLVTRTTPKALYPTIAQEIDRLHVAHPHGTIAIISCHPEGVRDHFRKAGWRVVRTDVRYWELADKKVATLTPDDARGIEFDAVIVVEPAEFPSNFGRQGPLYTALTRANRELAVVHAKPLPSEFAGRRRRAPTPSRELKFQPPSDAKTGANPDSDEQRQLGPQQFENTPAISTPDVGYPARDVVDTADVDSAKSSSAEAQPQAIDSDKSFETPARLGAPAAHAVALIVRPGPLHVAEVASRLRKGGWGKNVSDETITRLVSQFGKRYGLCLEHDLVTGTPTEEASPFNGKTKTQSMVQVKRSTRATRTTPKPRQLRASSNTALIETLRRMGVPYQDNRQYGGALWIYREKEFRATLEELKPINARFYFGRHRKRGLDGWWSKDA